MLARDDAEATRELADADAAHGTITPALLAAAPRLRWLQIPQLNPIAEGYFFPALVRHPVVVTNVRGIYNDHIATHVMAYVLAFARGLDRFWAQQVRREWRPGSDDAVVHLPDATALVVGVGEVGSQVASFCAMFGMRVIGVDVRRTEPPPGMTELGGLAALDAMLPRADFVIVTVPKTPTSPGLMDRRRLRLMKRTAFLMNIGRGPTVPLADLVAALEQGELAGAALDVFETEPLPADHPLWSLPRVIITPHASARGPYLDERRFEVLLENARLFAAGRPLRNVIDKETWF